MSKSLRGRVFSEEHKQKISKARKGINSRPNYKKHPEETIIKMRVSHLQLNFLRKLRACKK